MRQEETIQIFLADFLNNLTGYKGDIDLEPVSGGSINQCFRVSTKQELYFLKVNNASRFPRLFETEIKSLEILRNSNSIRVPIVIGLSELENLQLLLMEWIEPSVPTKAFWKKFGQRLAGLHQITDDQFGLAEDNYMGSLSQSNKPCANWTEFFINERLQPQLKLAKDKFETSVIKQFEILYQRLPDIFPESKPSLVHGDLWSGNFLITAKDEPVLIDPAVYYGHPSVDLGLSTLFGGFDETFYESYQNIVALPANYKEQWEIANLYPLLIHLNLFGNSYLGQIMSILKKYC